MFIAVFFTICPKWKQPKRPSTKEQINSVAYLYYIISQQKGKKLLTHAIE